MKELLRILVGEWLGEGVGEYPTIASFRYREALRFVATGDGLHYEQRTQRQVEHDQFTPSHHESGFIRLLPDKRVEITNAQIGGRLEVLIGTIEPAPGGLLMRLESTHFANDPRMEKATREIRVSGDTLNYSMYMQTSTVPHLALHIEANLHR